MQYSLVIQFALGDPDIVRFDALAELEDALAPWLSPDADVDGHDSGAGEMNIFIVTNDPIETFAKAKLLIDAKPEIGRYRAGYREEGEDMYQPLWPADLLEFCVA